MRRWVVQAAVDAGAREGMTTSEGEEIRRLPKCSGTPSPEAAVLALTREIPNYAERVAVAVGCRPSDLWALVLATSGRMVYAEPAANGERHVVELGVPDVVIDDGRTRFEIWRSPKLSTSSVILRPTIEPAGTAQPFSVLCARSLLPTCREADRCQADSLSQFCW